MQYRDIIQRQENKLEKKQTKKDFIKAVITDSLGNDSGNGEIWADRNTRRVWIRESGSASISQVPCYLITPTIGLGVIVGFEPYSTIREVLATDKDFLGQTNTTGTSYESPSNEDFLPGGRLQLWLDPRLITPLVTYPFNNTSLSINIIAGDYPYAGTRKSFAGQVDYSLSAYQPAGPNEHCLVGLYLDANNDLQAIAGSTVSTAVTAPEPIWPTGAFRLSVVDLDDTQTSFVLADDIQDRRMAWSDTNDLGVPITGAIITGDTTPEWTVLPRGTSGQYVTPNSTTGELEWRDIPTVGITEFLYDLASDIATYFQLDTDVPTGGSQTIVSAAVSASDTLIFNLATNSGGPGVDFINDGIWHLHLHAQKSGPGTKDVTLKFRVYYRTDPGGVETQIGSGYSHSTGNLTTSAAEYDLHFALGATDIAITDRIVLKIYADISGAGANPTVTITVEGTTDSRLEIPALVSGIGASKGWPTAGKAMINNTEYDSVQLAIDGMASGDIIKVGQGTDSGGIVPDTSGSIVGLSPVETIITRSDNDSITVSNSAAANLTLENLTISQTGAGTSVACIQSNQNGLRLTNLDILKESGTPTNSTGVSVYGGSGDGTYLLNCRISVTTGTNKYGVYTSTAASVVVIEGGEINAATADIYIGHASSVVELRGPKLSGGGINNAAGGTVRGWYIDAYGRIVRIKPIGINNVRLTLTSGTPVTTADVTAATTIYAALYKGNTIEVFNGVGWIEAPFTELSLSLSGFTADKNSDLWVYDNAGTLALERTEWTNDTTRATALTTQDGRYVKSGATTRLYLGTFRTTSTTGQCEDSAANRFVWNYYNRVLRKLRKYDNTAHTYNTATWRPFNNSATSVQVNFVIGVVEDVVYSDVGETITWTAGDSFAYVGMGLNSTSAPATVNAAFALAGAALVWVHGVHIPQTGYNFICPLEYSTATGNAPTWNESEMLAEAKC